MSNASENRFSGANIEEVQASALRYTVIFTGFAVCGVGIRSYTQGSDPTFLGVLIAWCLLLSIFCFRNRIGIERSVLLVLFLFSGTQFFMLRKLGLLSGAPYLLMFGFVLSGLLTEQIRLFIGAVVSIAPLLYITISVMAGASAPVPEFAAEFAALPTSWLTLAFTAALLGCLTVVIFSALTKKISSERKHYRQSVFDTMMQLSLLRDHETGSHLQRCSEFAVILLQKCQSVGFKNSIAINADVLADAVKLHDIGKIAISDAILNKPGKLTETEFAAMQRHTSVGAEIIEQIARVNEITDDPVIEMGRDIARHHHENWDGSGYPDGKTAAMEGNVISLPSRIMAIVDVYDALRSGRPYKEPFSHEKTLAIMGDMKGAKFDPDLFELFLEVAEQFDATFAVVSEYAQ